MPSRKADQIVQVLRSQILSGERAPGARLPTYDDFTEQFGVTRPTLARGLKALRSEGLVTVDGTRGVFVAKTFPHHTRYLWVSSEQPGSPGWTSLSATILDLIERGETGIPGDVIPLVGVDGRMNNPAYRRLCDAIERGAAAGLVLMGSATTSVLPILQAPGLPRVVVGAVAPHAAPLGLDLGALIERASARLMKAGRGRRVAVFSPHALHLERARESLLRRGLDERLLSTLHVAPVGCEQLVELLFERAERPDAVLVTDDSLVPPLLAGLARARVRVGRDVHVLAHCTWPRPLGVEEGVEHIGFDARELLAAARDCLDAQRGGARAPDRALAPRLANEVVATPTARRAPEARPAPADVETMRRSSDPSPKLSSAA